MGISTDSIAPEQVWRRRPVLAGVVRTAVFVVPVLAALAASVGLSRLLPDPSGIGPVVLWWAVLIAGMVLTTVLVERVCRRALPLGALLNVALLFPDRAPSRFAVARRRGRPAELRAELDRVLAERGPDPHALDDPDTHAALTVLTLLAAIAAHDLRTRGHSERVRILVDMIAEEMDLPEIERYRLRWAALLHDVGKIDVAPSLLNKPGEPDHQEWEVLHRHPAEGDRLCSPIREWLGDWADTALHHHERWDGHGYPLGLSGEDICLGGRIVAVADTFEVMTAHRPYHHAVKPSAARAELVAKAGTQFDPEVCRAFLNISVGRLWRVAGVVAWMGEMPLLAPLAAAIDRLGVQGVARLVVGGSASVAAATGAIALPPGAVPGPVPTGAVSAAVQPAAPAPDPCCPPATTTRVLPWGGPPEDGPAAPASHAPAPVAIDPPATAKAPATAGTAAATTSSAPPFTSQRPTLVPASGHVTSAAPSTSTGQATPSPDASAAGSGNTSPADKRCDGDVPAASRSRADEHSATAAPAACSKDADGDADPDADGD